MKLMDEGKYLTVKEMSDISKLCDGLTELYTLEQTLQIGTGFFTDDDGLATTFKVFDVNGEPLGRIGFCDNGEFGLYLDTSEEE